MLFLYQRLQRNEAKAARKDENVKLGAEINKKWVDIDKLYDSDLDPKDDNPDNFRVFTRDDFEDKRISKLLQQRQSDPNEQEIFITDLLDADDTDDEIPSLDDTKDRDAVNQKYIENQKMTAFLNDDDAKRGKEEEEEEEDDDKSHQKMLENIFKHETKRNKPNIAGSQLEDDPMNISSVNDLTYAVEELGRSKRYRPEPKLHVEATLGNLDESAKNKRVSMKDMINSLQVPLGKVATKQIGVFSDVADLSAIKLKAQSKITKPHVAVCHAPKCKDLGFRSLRTECIESIQFSNNLGFRGLILMNSMYRNFGNFGDFVEAQNLCDFAGFLVIFRKSLRFLKSV